MAEHSVYYRHFELPANFPVIGLVGDAWHSEYTETFRLHFHNCLEIGYMYEGEASYYLRERVLPLKAPCITIAPPNAPHIMVPTEGSVCGWKWLYTDPIRLLPHMAPQKAAELGMYQYRMQGQECVLPQEEFPEFYDLIGLASRLMERAEGDWQGAVREILHAFFLLLLSCHPLSGNTVLTDRYEGVLAPAIAYIMEAYMQDLSIRDLAARCHLSDAHFRRVFKQTYGWSPLDYIHTIRIERACALLFDGHKSISEIATSVGYSTPSTFTRQFHHFYGMSPSQWRQKMESEENESVSRYLRTLPPSAQHFFPQDDLRYHLDRHTQEKND